MSIATNSNVPVPGRGSAFNLKGLRKGTSERYAREVFTSLLPGSHFVLWEETRGKSIRRTGRLYVTQEVMSVYPEFRQSLETPGKSVPIDIGPFELVIWTRKKKQPRKQKVLEKELELVKKELQEQKGIQKQTQAMLDLLLESERGEPKNPQASQKRSPKRSPVRKRVRLVKMKQDSHEKMQVETSERSFKSSLKEMNEKLNRVDKVSLDQAAEAFNSRLNNALSRLVVKTGVGT